jgi:hypothetical protein
MTNFNFFVPAMLIFIFASVLGCLFLVIAWAKVIMEPFAVRGSQRVAALHLFTTSVGLEALGSGIITTIPDGPRTTAWLIVFIVSFALVIGSAILVRNDSGPEKQMVKIGSIVLFFVYVIGFSMMIVTRPGIQPN